MVLTFKNPLVSLASAGAFEAAKKAAAENSGEHFYSDASQFVETKMNDFCNRSVKRSGLYSAYKDCK